MIREKEKKWIVAEWIDENNEYHSGVYPKRDKAELERNLNKWAFENRIKSFDIRETESIIEV